MLLPVVAYRYGSRDFGRSGATVLGLLLALWPDGLMAGMQGRSYSLLMLFALAHLYYFKRLATAPDRRSGLLFAATLAVACTLHIWFVIVAGAELLFLGLLKVAARLRWGIFGIRTPLRVETFLSLLTLGGLCAAVVQAGILPKFVFILTQKGYPSPIEARMVLVQHGGIPPGDVVRRRAPSPPPIATSGAWPSSGRRSTSSRWLGCWRASGPPARTPVPGS